MANLDEIQEFLRRHGRAILFLLGAVLVVHDIFGPHGFLAMRRTQREITRVKQDLDRLNEDNRELAGQVKALKTDPQLIEQIARDEMGLARRGEVIIRIPRRVAPRPGAGQTSVPARP